MGRGNPRLRREATQVDDPFDAGGRRFGGEALGGTAVAAGEVAPAVRRGLHRVDEVVGDRAAVERGPDALPAEQVAAHCLDARA